MVCLYLSVPLWQMTLGQPNSYLVEQQQTGRIPPLLRLWHWHLHVLHELSYRPVPHSRPSEMWACAGRLEQLDHQAFPGQWPHLAGCGHPPSEPSDPGVRPAARPDALSPPGEGSHARSSGAASRPLVEVAHLRNHAGSHHTGIEEILPQHQNPHGAVEGPKEQG